MVFFRLGQTRGWNGKEIGTWTFPKSIYLRKKCGSRIFDFLTGKSLPYLPNFQIEFTKPFTIKHCLAFRYCILYKSNDNVFCFYSIRHEDYENTDVIIYSSGLIYWVPPMTLHTTCELDYSYWPWDTQKCCMIIGSWTKSGWEIDVVNMNHKNVRHPFFPFTSTVCNIWKWLKH